MTGALTISPTRLAELLALALRLGVDRLPSVLRANGLPAGPELAVLQALLAVPNAQERSPLAEVAGPGQGDLVPLAYDFADAGKLLGVSESTVRRVVAAGELRAVSIGRSRRIPADELTDYLRRRIEEAA